MGGFGSGRWERQGVHETTDDHLRVDVRRWHREGLLTPDRLFDWSWSQGGQEAASIRVQTGADLVLLNYRRRGTDGEWEDVTEPVTLDWTPCHIAGHRPWFRCPGIGDSQPCGRRCAILYAVAGMFRCRSCGDLRYQSQRENDLERARSRLARICSRLVEPPPGEPGRLRYRAFDALRMQLVETRRKQDAAMAAQCDWVHRGIDKKIEKL